MNRVETTGSLKTLGEPLGELKDMYMYLIKPGLVFVVLTKLLIILLSDLKILINIFMI